MSEFIDTLQAEHKILEDRINEFLSGKINAADLKHDAAPFGIYEQKNGLFMVRIRIPGGEISYQGITDLSEIFRKNNVSSLHLTTRQDIQLHDIPPRQIIPIVKKCTEKGFVFRGGGGNTYRNILASHTSGVTQDSVFDIYPHVHFLNEYLLKHDKAFGLPRKFKIALVSSENETLTAQTNDLGFVAKEQSGQKGFQVYLAGGIGRNYRTGISIREFLPEEEILPFTLAALHLFNDHGNRENRNKARLRFVLNELGEEKFKALFEDYYANEKANVNLPVFSHTSTTIPDYKTYEEIDVFFENFSIWQALCTAQNSLATDLASFTFNVPEGNIEAKDFAQLIEILNFTRGNKIRLTPNQDIFFPGSHKSALYHLYSNFTELFNSYHGEFLENYFTSCVGASVCKIGIIDTPALSRKVALNLKPIVSELDAKAKVSLLKDLIDNIRFSGCQNSCATQQKATLGFQGMKKKINELSVECCAVYQKGKALLAEQKENLILPLEEIPEFVASIVASFLKQKRDDQDLTLKSFLQNYNLG